MFEKIIVSLVFLSALSINAQSKITLLKANEPGGTYQLINNVFSPMKGNVVESPGIELGDCNNHSSFESYDCSSNHISEVYDPEMGHVFKFTIHVKEDKDRNKCGNSDRQRNEIKTYNPSPEYLKATPGEIIEYNWTMKLPKDFKASASFTHLHQIKSVGGIIAEEKIPSITLTAYNKKDKEEMHIRHSGTTSQETIAVMPLGEFKGKWIEFTETIDFKKGKKGNYHILIKNLETEKTILDFKYKGIMFKKDAKLMRPKWGIYRSLNDRSNLKDEEILFGYFQIKELVSNPPKEKK